MHTSVVLRVVGWGLARHDLLAVVASVMEGGMRFLLPPFEIRWEASAILARNLTLLRQNRNVEPKLSLKSWLKI